MARGRKYHILQREPVAEGLQVPYFTTGTYSEGPQVPCFTTGTYSEGPQVLCFVVRAYGWVAKTHYEIAILKKCARKNT